LITMQGWRGPQVSCSRYSPRSPAPRWPARVARLSRSWSIVGCLAPRGH